MNSSKLSRARFSATVSSPTTPPWRSSGIRPTLAAAELGLGSPRSGPRSPIQILPARWLAHAGEHLGQLGLAVAGDPGDAQDFAVLHLQADILQRRQPFAYRARSEFSNSSASACAQDCPPGDHAEALPADHHRASSAWVVSAFWTVPTTLPSRSTVTRSQIGITSYSLWLMKTTDKPSLLQAGPASRRALDFLRDQHCGRLIQDQHAGIAVERLENFHPLALAHRKMAHQRLRFHLDAKALGRLQHFLLQRLACPGGTSVV